ncbi:metal-dependent hydrolase [Halomarina pelagica]|uniref:metal-dependent hydrolase n=1 Tax=Halomarina pelagica TaxID=2961599 RepID=UPI0020C3B2E1|nr:metal-dependent hydrolase [Halomarina sp. BND7]
MMAVTHVLVGMALSGVVLAFAPDLAPVALAAGALGGAFPDFDLYVGHRRTLHYPVYATLGGLVALAVSAATPAPLTVALAAFLLAAGVHAAMDALGGGLELKPWERTSERAVYSHFHDRWLRPRRWVRYDGAPEDLALSAVVAAPLLALYDPPVSLAVGALLAVAMGYALLRKRLADCWAVLVALLPPSLATYLPDRFGEVRGDGGEVR